MHAAAGLATVLFVVAVSAAAYEVRGNALVFSDEEVARCQAGGGCHIIVVPDADFPKFVSKMCSNLT